MHQNLNTFGVCIFLRIGDCEEGACRIFTYFVNTALQTILFTKSMSNKYIALHANVNSCFLCILSTPHQKLFKEKLQNLVKVCIIPNFFV
jgi:hypothetical protein